MAKTFDGTNITNGFNIKAGHVSQSVDAFTGAKAYDITISGSLVITGSIPNTAGNPAVEIEGDTKLTGQVSASRGFIVGDASGTRIGSFVSKEADVVTSRGVFGAGNGPGASPEGTVFAEVLNVDEITSRGGTLNIRATNITASQEISCSQNIRSGNVFVGNFPAGLPASPPGLIYATGNITSETGNILATSGKLLTNNITSSGDVQLLGNTFLGGIITSNLETSEKLTVSKSIDIDSGKVTYVGKKPFGGFTIPGALTLTGSGVITDPASRIIIGEDPNLGIPSIFNGTLMLESNIANSDITSFSTGSLRLSSPYEITMLNQSSSINLTTDTNSTGVIISGSSPNCGLDVRGPIETTDILTVSKSIDIDGGKVTYRGQVPYFGTAIIPASLTLTGSASEPAASLQIGTDPGLGLSSVYNGTLLFQSKPDISAISSFSTGSLDMQSSYGLNLVNISSSITLTPNNNSYGVVVSGSSPTSSLEVRGPFRIPKTSKVSRNFSDSLPEYSSCIDITNNDLVTNGDTVPVIKFQSKFIGFNRKPLIINCDWDVGRTSGSYGDTQGFRGGAIHFGGGQSNGNVNGIAMTFDRPYTGEQSLLGGFGLQLNGVNSTLVLSNDRAYKSTAGSWLQTSDSRLKENIITASIDTCYDGVKNLPLKYYKWKEGIQKGPVDDTHMLGWIAQDVKNIFPKAVQSYDFTAWSTYTGSVAITGSISGSILKPGGRYQDVLAGSEIIKDRQILQSDQITKMMYGAIQKLQEKVEALELQISGSNS